MDPSLIDRIYECAFAPEFWPAVMDEFAKISGTLGGMLLVTNAEDKPPILTSSSRLRAMNEHYLETKLYIRDQATRKLRSDPHPGFMRDIDILTKEEIEHEPLYRELLWPFGMANPVGTTIRPPTGDTLACIVIGDRAKDPMSATEVQRLDALRPHLARSALISARLRLERARAVAETLNLLGLPALVLDYDGRVVAANALIEAETQCLKWLARDRVSLSDRSADAMLQSALASLGHDPRQAVRSFAVRDADSVAAKVAHIVPVRGASRDIFARSAGVLVLTPVALPKAPPVALIQSLFDLTPAEAAVARNLTTGESLREIAQAGGVSHNTVRTQLRAVLEKTGCSRQAEVVALLSGLAPPRA